ncbi:YqzL family protein [Clostridium sp. D2Q-14]|nr:YqzL family protein [Anaeromonas gelatinilytica]MBS4535281.1 YqzL family protein [Anaeromonas gelatinilytica]
MLENDIWKIFETTGKIDAYLYYKELVNNQENQSNQNTREVNDKSSNM